MTKKVLILSSSPRRGGNSDTLCDEFMRGAIESGNEAEKVFLRDKTIHYCTGCSTCSLHGKPCPQKDDAGDYREDGGSRCNSYGYTRLFLHDECTDENVDRPLLWPLYEDEE